MDGTTLSATFWGWQSPWLWWNKNRKMKSALQAEKEFFCKSTWEYIIRTAKEVDREELRHPLPMKQQRRYWRPALPTARRCVSRPTIITRTLLTITHLQNNNSSSPGYTLMCFPGSRSLLRSLIRTTVTPEPDPGTDSCSDRTGTRPSRPTPTEPKLPNNL